MSEILDLRFWIYDFGFTILDLRLKKTRKEYIYARFF